MRPVRGALARVAILAGIAGFVALGVWQVERRAWKLDLIARVDARVAAAPVAPPGAGGLAAGRRRSAMPTRVSGSPAASGTIARWRCRR